jgi:hypothetical protein
MGVICPLLDGWCFASHRWQFHLWSSDFSSFLTNESWIVEHPLPPHVRESIPPSLKSSHALHFITPTIGPPGGFNQYNHRRLIFYLLLNLRKKTLGGFCRIVTSLESGVSCSPSTASFIFESPSSLQISLDSSKQKFKSNWQASRGGRPGPQRELDAMINPLSLQKFLTSTWPTCSEFKHRDYKRETRYYQWSSIATNTRTESPSKKTTWY